MSAPRKPSRLAAQPVDLVALLADALSAAVGAHPEEQRTLLTTDAGVRKLAERVARHFAPAISGAGDKQWLADLLNVRYCATGRAWYAADGQLDYVWVPPSNRFLFKTADTFIDYHFPNEENR